MAHFVSCFGFPFRSKKFCHRVFEKRKRDKTRVLKNKTDILKEYNEIFCKMKEYQSNREFSINASTVSFEGLQQNFIATTAPKVDSFVDFWQMVIERDVKIIVMLNSLHDYDRFSEFDEGHFYNNMTKRLRQKFLPVCDESFEFDGEESRISCTSQRGGSIIRMSNHEDKDKESYWPCGANKVRELKNGIRLILLSTQQRGSIIIRTLQLSRNGEFVREVTHLQEMYKWDLSVRRHEGYDHTKNMGDLLVETMNLCSSSSQMNPILVHSCVRTGDTGVFIANLKLKTDLQNKKNHYTDVKSTVTEMLLQRRELIQSPQQYLNIYKFLQDEISVL